MVPIGGIEDLLNFMQTFPPAQGRVVDAKYLCMAHLGTNSVRVLSPAQDRYEAPSFAHTSLAEEMHLCVCTEKHLTMQLGQVPGQECAPWVLVEVEHRESQAGRKKAGKDRAGPSKHPLEQ